jgi:MoaA/NifB/PqqE/SkfB family radical SAM enzyme
MCSAYEFRQTKFEEMQEIQLKRMVEQVKPFTPSFYFGGGEPLIRDDIVSLVRVVKEAGLRLGIVTNGLRLTSEMRRELVRYGLDHILVSIHGPEETHDRITGVKGSFKKTTSNIEAFCKEKGNTFVMLNFVVSSDNLHKMRDLVLLGKELGVDKVRIEHLLFITDEERQVHEEWCQMMCPPPLAPMKDVSTLVCQIGAVRGFSAELPLLLNEIKKEFGDFVFVKPALSDKEIEAWYSHRYRSFRRCVFVWRSLFVDPEGYVIPCQHYAGLKMGNINKEPLLEIWNSRRYKLFRKLIRRGIAPGCSRCCKI